MRNWTGVPKVSVLYIYQISNTISNLVTWTSNITMFDHKTYKNSLDLMFGWPYMMLYVCVYNMIILSKE